MDFGVESPNKLFFSTDNLFRWTDYLFCPTKSARWAVSSRICEIR